MKKIYCLLIFTVLILSCRKNEDKPVSENVNKKDSTSSEKVVNKKDSVTKSNNYNWEGEYDYTANEGNKHQWNYNLKIKKEQNGYSAIFDVFGYQTAYPMKGYVVVEGNKARVYFDDFHDEPMIRDIKKGDLLIELEYTDSGLLTYWQDAIGLEKQKGGVVALKKVMNNSFIFLNRDVVFGTSKENFLTTFPEFKANNELTQGQETGVTYKLTLKSCEIEYNIYFDKSGLNKFKMHSNCSSNVDGKYTQSILKQFKRIKSKGSDDGEMGDIMELYKKGKLRAEEFGGGLYELTITQVK